MEECVIGLGVGFEEIAGDTGGEGIVRCDVLGCEE